MKAIGLRSLSIVLLVGTLWGCAGKQEPARFEVTAVEPGKQDKEIEALVAPYKAEVDKLRLPIGRSSVEMSREKTDSPIGSWVADALRAQTEVATGRKVDVLMLNGGGIRNSLPKGDISYMTINNILPFENTVVLYEYSGTQLQTMAELLASRRGADPISGLTIDATADYKLNRALVNGEPIDPNRRYTFATISFLAQGNSGFGILTKDPHVDTGLLMRDLVADHVRAETKQGRTIDMPAEPYRYRFGGKTVKEIQ